MRLPHTSPVRLPHTSPVRLASFNILHGSSMAGGPVSTEQLAGACDSLHADVLCLQEVDRGQARSGGADQTAAVAEAVGAADWRFEPALVGEPGGVWREATDHDRGSTDPCYGVALVSRFPVTAWHTVRLPASPVSSPVYIPGRGPRFILLADEPRVSLVAEIALPTGILLAASTHLSFVPGWNLVQLRRLTRALDELAAATRPAAGRPSDSRSDCCGCVLLGDLNVPFSWAARGWTSLARARTFPAARPSMQLDYALGRGRLPEVVGSEAVELAVSDHRALVVDLAGRPDG